jgi:hypothetical protein
LDKSSITGSPTLDERFGFKPTPTTTVDVSPEIDESKPTEYLDEIWEAPSGYLRCARHQVFALELIKRSGELCMIPYSAIDSGTGKCNGDKFSFIFFKGEAAYEATIEGTTSRPVKRWFSTDRSPVAVSVAT